MTVYDVTTQSGTRYIIDVDGSFWVRVPTQPHVQADHQRIWRLCPLDSIEDARKVSYDLELKVPEVGKSFFISGKDIWFVSTPVVSITEVDDYMQAFRDALAHLDG